MTIKVIYELLNLNQDARDELGKADDFEFDVFKLRKASNNQEMSALLPYLMAKKGILLRTKINFEKFFTFTQAI